MRALLLLLALASASCSRATSGRIEEQLPEGVLARVGSYVLRADALVEAGPRASEFARRWTDAGHFVRAMEEERPSAARAVTRAVLAREFMESWRASMLARGPVEPEEAETATSSAWLELKRPRAVRAAEIFLRVRLLESDEKARAKMEKIRERVSEADSTVQFGELATEAAKELDAEIAGRIWPPVAADGRVVPVGLGDDPGERVPEEIVRAATALTEPGEKSPVVGTAGGYHLLIAHEIIPERIASDAELSELVRPLVAADRGRAELENLKRELRSRTPVVLSEQRASLLKLIGRKR